jgi:hypothetical protein
MNLSAILSAIVCFSTSNLLVEGFLALQQDYLKRIFIIIVPNFRDKTNGVKH